MAATLTALVLLSLVLAGCATKPVNARETGDPTDSQLWRTTRRVHWIEPWPTETWRSFVDRMRGTKEEAVYFTTQEACESFRAAQPTYSKSDEACQRVHGRVVSGQP